MDAFDLSREGCKGEAGQKVQGHVPVSLPHGSSAQLVPAWAVVYMEAGHHGVHFSLVEWQGQLPGSKLFDVVGNHSTQRRAKVLFVDSVSFSQEYVCSRGTDIRGGYCIVLSKSLAITFTLAMSS